MANFIKNYLTTTDLVVILITVGLITVITLVAYTLEKKVSKASPFFIRLGEHIIESALLIVSILLLRQVFTTINHGYFMTDAWLYANAQIAVAFFGILILNNRLVELITLAFPFLYNPALNESRFSGPYMTLFFSAYVVMLITVDYAYSHKDEMLISSYKYTIAQTVFALCWWSILWIDYHFNPYKIIISMIFFEIFMVIIRITEKRLRLSFADFKDLEIKANYDALTGVKNRSSLNTASKELFQEFSEKEETITVAMFDIDHFKKFNDTYGHEIGDEVLRHVAHLTERELMADNTDGPNGQLYRYGGEEFIIIFKDKTTDEAAEVIYDIRKTLKDIPLFINGAKLNVTLCFGITSVKKSDASTKEILERVDGYLYQSKNNGRNRVTIEGNTYTYDNLKIAFEA
ncbi:GGDEF domain-containing protein [Companilactobacillus insicii]|uniref:GGDEF domain-containing protein n=1 Tax=Companilactobacillus insicii TaxID=1732567 RepID=UPI000F79F137|nr:GGDEF domain-containing protein [Companilactobacillus insicii]